jgi:hypothetical protein
MNYDLLNLQMVGYWKFLATLMDTASADRHAQALTLSHQINPRARPR